MTNIKKFEVRSVVVEMIDTLQKLQNDFKDSSINIDLNGELSSADWELSIAAEKLRTGLAAAGKPDAERCEIASDLVIRWAVDACTAAFEPLQFRTEYRGDALMAVLMDHRWQDRRAAAKRLAPLLDQILRVKGEEIEADRRQLKTERDLVRDVETANVWATSDRQLLGIPPTAELTHELVDAARAAAEAKAGLNKRGKPYVRFENAAKRLILTIEYKVVRSAQ